MVFLFGTIRIIAENVRNTKQGYAPCFDDWYRDTLLAVLKKRRCFVTRTYVQKYGGCDSENRRQCHRYADYGADWM